MLFNSLEFLCFFPIICVLYWVLRRVLGTGSKSLFARNLLLLAGSYYFYMCWQPKYALLLLTSTAVTYFGALLMERFQQRRKTVLVTAIVLNLCILFFYKYFNFVAESLTAFLQVCGMKMTVPGLKVLLPVGISFYIFQALGYLIDVYRKEIPAERNFFTYALFVSFFPQLVAGPIERSKNLLRQFKEDHPFDADFAISGFKLMLWGYFMKLCLADQCSQYVDLVFNNLNDHEGMSTLIASFLFTFQIYGDFAGYTFIAIGCARILGFSLNDNFRRPYFATTITEFWHRWHISLSSWLRDYVYIPLGGSRAGKGKTYRNILLTFLISGIWHGANWTFILWGVLHGAIQCLERLVGWGKKQWTGLRKWAHIAITFMIANIAWVLFRANTLADAVTAFRLMLLPSDFSLGHGRTFILYSFVSVVIVFLHDLIEEHDRERKKSTLRDIFYITLMVILIGCLGNFGGGQFIYFQF